MASLLQEAVAAQLAQLTTVSNVPLVAEVVCAAEKKRDRNDGRRDQRKPAHVVRVKLCCAGKAEQKCSTVVSNSCRAEGPKPHFQQLQGPKAHISTVGGPGEFQQLFHSWGAPPAPPNCGTNVGPARRAGKIWGYDAIKHTYLMKLTDAMN